MLEKDIEEKKDEIEIIDLDNIEEVKEVQIETKKSFEEEKKNENLINKEDIVQNNDDKYIKLSIESERQLQAKKDLVDIFENLKNKLDTGENIPKNIIEVYEIYLDNKYITKSHIKEKIGGFLLKFMFFFIGPLFGITFLIGIFQIKSLMSALFDLIKKSVITYYDCNVKSNCNITITENQKNEFDFYDYYYNTSMDETIDFNLMMITGFIGNILIKWKGFKISTGILCIPILIGVVWLFNFDFNFSNEGIFDYDILKLITLLLIYALLLCGIGGSALLSNQILVESHLKYKDYFTKKMEGKLKRQKTINEEILVQENEIKEKEEKKQKIFEENIEKKKQNKFDYYFMICLTTIVGYLGKYSINLLLDYFLCMCMEKNIIKDYFCFIQWVFISFQ